MRISRSKLFALVSMLVIGSGMMTIAVNAAAVPDRATASYISVAPKTIGVGQQLTVNAWIFPAPSGPTLYAQDLPGYRGMTVTFTRPDGSKDTFVPTHQAFIDSGHPEEVGLTDAVGTLYFYYKPNAAGTWHVSLAFPGQTFTTSPSPDTVYYKPSTSSSFTFTVQEDPVNAGIINGWPYAPLPTGYWQRPISASNREWYSISGDWLYGSTFGGGYDSWGTSFNPYSAGPNAPHIVWKKEVAMGGIIGGDWGSISYRSSSTGAAPPGSVGSAYYEGGAAGQSYYGGTGLIIMSGKVYYNDVAGGTFSCVDLRTGQLLYRTSGYLVAGQHLRPETATPGKTPQVHESAVVSHLWDFGTGGQWKRIDPLTGTVMQTLTNVAGNTQTAWFEEGNPIVFLTQRWNWNTTLPLKWQGEYLIKWDYDQVTGNNWQTGVVWNVSLRRSDGIGVGDGRLSVGAYVFDGANVVVCKAHNDENLFMGFDMTTGARLYTRFYDFIDVGTISLGMNGPICMFDSATITITAFDVKTGNTLWKSDRLGDNPWSSLSALRVCYASEYNTLYWGSYDGHVYAIDTKTGKLRWTSDFVGENSETVFNTTPIGSIVGADGKIYASFVYPWEFQPRSRFRELWCWDAQTGKALWHVPGSFLVGGVVDGNLLAANVYDAYLYCFGKGKTETTVSILNNVIAKGSSALIEGAVMDLSPAQAGTPAVAKESMSEWMDYLHMQNATLINNPPSPKGVPLQLYAVDPNGNVQDIGSVTTDSLGHYEIMWKPPVEGTYKVLASFAGDDSYWSSSAETALGVTEAAATANAGAEQPTAAPDYTLMFAGVFIAIIILAILVVYLIVKKK